MVADGMAKALPPHKCNKLKVMVEMESYSPPL